MEKMTAERFKEVVGVAPEQDDLERANCEKAGQPGHWQCGLCEHKQPRFLFCSECAR